MGRLAEIKTVARHALSRSQAAFVDTIPREEPATGARVLVVGSPRLGSAPNEAAKTYRMGLARAFAELGHPTAVVNLQGLALSEPTAGDVVIASAFDLALLPRSLQSKLALANLIVWVSQWFPEQKRFCRSHGLPDIGTGPRTVRAVETCAPRAIFTSNTAVAYPFFENWIVEYGHLQSIPLAYDRSFYESSIRAVRPEFEQSVVYVGGYWPYKGRTLRRYLMPFREQLAIFGYSHWPFGEYRGTLGIDEEADVLRSAAVVPGINEPHALIMGGDVCERVYKVAGLGGLCVADGCPGYRDLFTSDELLMPSSYAEYLEVIRAILAGELDVHRYRASGRRAVHERHLYTHRANAILDALGIARRADQVPAAAATQLT